MMMQSPLQANNPQYGTNNAHRWGASQLSDWNYNNKNKPSPGCGGDVSAGIRLKNNIGNIDHQNDVVLVESVSTTFSFSLRRHTIRPYSYCSWAWYGTWRKVAEVSSTCPYGRTTEPCLSEWTCLPTPRFPNSFRFLVFWALAAAGQTWLAPIHEDVGKSSWASLKLFPLEWKWTEADDKKTEWFS